MLVRYKTHNLLKQNSFLSFFTDTMQNVHFKVNTPRLSSFSLLVKRYFYDPWGRTNSLLRKVSYCGEFGSQDVNNMEYTSLTLLGPDSAARCESSDWGDKGRLRVISYQCWHRSADGLGISGTLCWVKGGGGFPQESWAVINQSPVSVACLLV